MNDDADIKPFKGQKWQELKTKYNRNNLFEDPLFPATTKSLYYSSQGPKGAVWRRAGEAIKNPQFVVDGFNRCDLDQGFLGNCWFIAGCVGIMQSDKCFAKVVPRDQDFGKDYGGIFHFRFWLYGQWFDVVIDDRLAFWPDGNLVFCSNKQCPNELWGALLEKAYAKVFGAYESLDGGITTDALIDMSGGVEESFEMKDLLPLQKKNFWTILFQGYKKSSVVACSMEADAQVREAVQSNGLIKGHAYTVVDMTEFESNGKIVRLLKCRNPWGDDREWTGPWSDKSKEWKTVSNEIKNKINFKIDADGEFWMSYEDFIRTWDTVQICHLTLDSFSEELLKNDDDSDLCWNLTSYEGEWKVPLTSGGNGSGGPENQKKFWTNPQFLITLKDIDTNDNENMATIIIALMQQDARLKKIHIENNIKRIVPIQNNIKNEEEAEEFGYFGFEGVFKEFLNGLDGEEGDEENEQGGDEEGEKDEEEDMEQIMVKKKAFRVRAGVQNNAAEEQAEEFIQFRIFRVKDNVKIDQNQSSGLRFYANQLTDAGDTGTYLNRREITKRFRVPPGNYVIIPSTFDADKNGKFLLRIYTESLISAKKLGSHKSTLETEEVKIPEKPKMNSSEDIDKIIKNTPKVQPVVQPVKPNQPVVQPIKPNQPVVQPVQPNQPVVAKKADEIEDACFIM